MSDFSGMEISGLSVDGAAFMSPNDLGADIWLRRGVGVNASPATQWNDSSANARNFSGGSTSYDAGTGILSFNASTFFSLTSNVPNASYAEMFFVVKFPDLARTDTLFSKSIGTGIDTDARKVIKNSSNKYQLTANVAGGVNTISVDSLPEDTWLILSISGSSTAKHELRRSNIRQAISAQGTFTFAGGAETRMVLAGEARNSGGVPTTAINLGKFDIADFAYFTTPLTTIQKQRLTNYYRQFYSDILT